MRNIGSTHRKLLSEVLPVEYEVNYKEVGICVSMLLVGPRLQVF